MKKRITEQDYLKAHRKASREEEIARHGRPVGQSRVHRSKKAYDRKRRRQASNACLSILFRPLCSHTHTYSVPCSPVIPARPCSAGKYSAATA
ncbi:hypothetical protein [Alistipes indistinctus]|uniref:hypothetical protein n=1 Tax=Alistipes indistinctus TaxID=626932 RepID=UPI003F0DC37F